jgi:hypothetical protein
MSVASVLAPKKPVWFRTTIVAAAMALGIYVVLATLGPWQPGRFWGLTFGIVAAVLFFNAGLYPFRRRWEARPLGTVQRWLQLHIYGSTLGALFVMIHMGFRWPAGAFGWWLFGLTMFTTLSGIVGVVLQKWIPIAISRNLRVEAIYERIPELVERLRAEATTTMRGANEPLARTYEADIQPVMAGPAPHWSYLFDIRGARARMLEPLTRIESFVSPEDQERLRDLTTVVTEKLDLDVHASLQRALRVWLYTHVPAAMALLALVTVHILAVVYF